MGFEGIEVDNARQAAGQLESSAFALLDAGVRVDLALAQLVWEGPNAKGFRDDWEGQFAEDFAQAVRALADNARGIREALAVQQRASGEAPSPVGGNSVAAVVASGGERVPNFLGGNTESMRDLAAVCRAGAEVVTEQVDQIKRLRGWMYGPSAVVAISYLRRRIVPALERIAEALREMATVLAAHAQAQEDASAGRPVATGLPQYRRRTPSAEERAVRGGVLQTLGGLIQIGGAVFFAPTGVAVPAGALGVDNVVAGVRSIIDQRPHQTVVHQIGAGTARLAGASDRTAYWVGVATEVGAGLGTGYTGSLTRGLSSEAARTAENAVIVATQRGHNIVGVRIGGVPVRGTPNVTETIGDLRVSGGVASFEFRHPSTTAAMLERNGMSVRYIPVEARQAEQGLEAMRQLRTRLAQDRPDWSRLGGPNCTTTTCDVVTGAGVNLPLTARTSPRVLDWSVREIRNAPAGGAAIGAGQVLGTAGQHEAGAEDGTR